MLTTKENVLSKSFSYNFNTSKSSEEIFELLLSVKKWWSGFHEETITGNSVEINDEFSFLAGGGVHYSKQRLIELVPNRKIVWQVIETNLTFLDNPKEWLNTKFGFDIEKYGEKSKVTFTHEGLVPSFECYQSCTTAWTEYMEQLEKMLN